MLNFSRWKAISILVAVAIGLLFALPNAVDETLWKRLPVIGGLNPMVLGLDLQGGSHVLLEVDRRDLETQLSKQLIADIRQALREQKIRYSGLGRAGTAVTVRITDAADHDRALTELRKLSQPVSTGIFGADPITNEFDVRRQADVISFTFTTGGLESKISRAVEQSLEILGKRIDDLGTREPTIQRQGVDRILIQVPGLQDPERLKELIGKTAQLQFKLLCESQPSPEADKPPLDCEEFPMREEPAARMWVQTSSRATVQGEDLVDAQPAFDSRNNEPIVSFRFNQKGALRFGKLTQENVGRPFAIILDSVVMSAPVINEPILGGTGQISGRFTTEEASDLAIVLRSGALPAKLSVVEERTVGPSLGSDSIRAGVIATLIGLLGVVAFMVIGYGLFGVFANIALLANLVMLVGLLSLMGATLTLPGIAGLLLTLGMAVDSNVLVYERIREEWRAGRSPVSAIETGFRAAMATIIDANLTTLIAVGVLFGVGSGPVRGFAVTLGLGILTTVFTAFTLTRLIIAWWLSATRPKVVPL
ncbi:MAG: protein translocase subunit SecD [Pseudomonadota bacterium]|nr:protein translocase subunit SecD [Pseudomonadota bacterium]